MTYSEMFGALTTRKRNLATTTEKDVQPIDIKPTIKNMRSKKHRFTENNITFK